MNMRYLLLFILFINIELYSKNSKHAKTRHFEQSEEGSVLTRGKQKNGSCSLTVKDKLSAGQLNVCGNSCLGNLTVTGTETVNGTLNVNGHLFVNGTDITTNCPTDCQITTPASSTDNAIVLFSGTTGRILKQSPAPVTIDPTNNINGVNNITMAGNLNMGATPDDLSAGVITKNNQRFIYDLGESTCTFIGVNAGLASANSFGNTGMGFEALGSLNSGSNNTAIGRQAMQLGATGSFNTAFGALSLIQATSQFNTAIGYSAMQGLAGQGNVAVGASALQTTTGSQNVAIGFGAGLSVFNPITGSNNIYIGANVGPVTAAETNTIRVGIIGGPLGQTACFIAGINNASISGDQVVIDSNGQLGLLPPSSRRYKQDIVDMLDSTANLVKLRPVTFRYKPEIEKSGEQQYGLIAEEVAEVYPNLVIYKDNQPESVKYHLLNVMLLNEVNKLTKSQKEQDKTNKELLARIAKLEGKAVT